MTAHYEIDELDSEILNRLIQDSRTPYLELARDLGVSSGTIHGRISKLKERGVLLGSQADINYEKLGFRLTAYIGIQVRLAKDVDGLIRQLEAFPEITEIHYTTGQFSLLVKALVQDMPAFHGFLSQKLQRVASVQSTETFMVLNTHLDRKKQVKAQGK